MRTRVVSVFVAFCVATATVGCTETEEPEQPSQFVFGGERSVSLRVPDAYDHGEATPLLIVLHGYSASGLLQLVYAHLDTVVNDHTVLVAAPDGTRDSADNLFWNATEACCDIDQTGVDDLGYISGLITEISGVWNVDPKRVYLFGHSNGGFMSYQMACHHADKIAAFISLAGAAERDPLDCSPSEPVSVLQIHGDLDEVIGYGGGVGFPSAEGSVARWANYNGCETTRSVDELPIDIDDMVAGSETVIERHDGCPSGIDAELWTLEGGGHIPRLKAEFAGEAWGWLAAHPKP